MDTETYNEKEIKELLSQCSEDDSFQIGNRIRILREGMDQTQEGLGIDLGYHKSTICDIERGEILPSVKFLKRARERLGFSPIYIIKDEGEAWLEPTLQGFWRGISKHWFPKAIKERREAFERIADYIKLNSRKHSISQIQSLFSDLLKIEESINEAEQAEIKKQK